MTAFTASDLVRYRMVYAAGMLLMLPHFSWVAAYPDSLYRPPVGPFELFDGFPAAWVLTAVEIGLAVSLAALFVGVRVGLASVATSVLMLTGYGFSYSLGKIDHNILVVIAPLLLLAAGWAGDREPSVWVMRLLAWVIGLGFLTAALPKLLAGWLDPATHATQGFFVQSYHAQERVAWLAGLLVHVDSPWFWEPLDWAAVALELSIIVAVVSWRSWRLAVASLTLFHVGVLLMMNISFATHVLVYAAFVPWGRLSHPRVTVPGWSVLPVALTAWGFTRVAGDTAAVVGPVILFAGGAIAAWHLFRESARARRTVVRRGAGPLPRPTRREPLHPDSLPRPTSR